MLPTEIVRDATLGESAQRTPNDDLPFNEEESVVRRVIGQLSTGNVSLQYGNFITENEFDEGIKHLESFSFLDRA